MSGLVVKNISKKFSSTPVLDNVSLELADGELLVLLGPSGCGKSTLLRIISGLEEADSGEIYIGGRRVDQLPPRARDVSLVFQNYSLYPHMSIAQNLAFPLSVAGVKKDEIKKRVQETANMLGLGDRLADKPGQLSGGQRQRVALGRAIIREPAIFLLDEPLSNLDADLRLRMRQEIVTLQKRLKKTMVHVTHDQVEALTMADRIALLNSGTVEQLGTPEELYRRPANIFTARFLGQPTINIFEGRIESGKLLPLGLPLQEETLSKLKNPFQVGIRPEAVEIHSTAELQGKLLSYEYLGDHYTMTLSFANLTLMASSVFASPPPLGQPVHFSVKASELLFFDTASGRRL